MKGVSACAIVLAIMAFARVAHAEPTPAQLYDRGAAAYDSGDYTHAVADLTRADAIAPDPITLELALKAALKADDAARGMELAERADTRRVPSAISNLAAQARGRFAAHAGKVHASCDTPCEPKLDDTPMETTTWATVGRHTVTFVRGGKTDRVAVTVIAEKTIDAVPPPVTVASPKPIKQEEAGPSPVWFWIAAGVTVAAGAATGISAADTASKHDEFAANPSSQAASTAGQNSQTRTNVLAAVTGGAALVTVAVGLFVVRW